MGSEGARLDAWASKFWEAGITGVDKEEQLMKSSNKGRERVSSKRLRQGRAIH